MKTLFDTSVLVSALVDSHVHHSRAYPWLQQAQAGRFEWYVGAHGLAELYAVLTALPLQPRIPPRDAQEMIERALSPTAHLVSLTANDYREVLREVADLGLSSGVIFDALLLKAARKAGAQRLLTFNVGDFQRLSPEGGVRIVSP